MVLDPSGWLLAAAQEGTEVAGIPSAHHAAAAIEWGAQGFRGGGGGM